MAGRRISRGRSDPASRLGRRMGGLSLQPRQSEGPARRTLAACAWLRPLLQCGARHRQRFLPRRPTSSTIRRPRSRRSCRRAAPMSAFRLPHGGRIDRGKRLRFSFDGRAYAGLAGDTLASALIANGVHLVGRSFKYHRPRGIVAAGADEPNALVTVVRDRGALHAEPARDAGRALRRARGGKPEPLALARVRSCRRERSHRAADPGGLLLQDLHVAAGRMEAALRAAHPRHGGARARADAARSGSLHAPLRALRRAGRRRRTGRACGRARGGRMRRAGDAVRRAGGARRLAACRKRRHDRRQGGAVLARRNHRGARAPRQCHAAAAHDGVRIFPAQHARAGRARDRASGRSGAESAARAAVAGARQGGRDRDRRDRAAAGLSRKRPAGDHAGGCGAHLRGALRGAAGHARGRRDRA